jgi:hypothetical protein
MENSVMTLRTRLLIVGAMLSLAGASASWAETQRPLDRLAQFKKDPETDPGGLPGRADERPRTRGIAPSSPAYRPPAKEEDKGKAPPSSSEGSTTKKDGSEKRK